MADAERLFQTPVENREKIIGVDWMSQIESETSWMTEGLFRFLLERLLKEGRLATLDLGHFILFY